MNKSPIIILTGPTGAGKTDLAMALVQQYPLEIISVDSAMVYKRMDIGSAKPLVAELKAAPHRLINIREPWEIYSVGDFLNDIKVEIARIRQRGKVPLLVGGTMMYFNALLKGLSELPEADESIRAAIEKEAQLTGWLAQHKNLQKIDPAAAAKINPNDQQRIQRALEVYQLTGKPLSSFWGQGDALLKHDDVTMIAVAPQDRAVLHQRIEKRWYQMIVQGVLEEAKALYDNPNINSNMPSMRSIGYRQIGEYFDGVWNETERDEKAIVATRRLAKRQLTWLRSFDGVHWFDSTDSKLIDQVKDLINKRLS